MQLRSTQTLRMIFDFLTILLFLTGISLPLLVMVRNPAREISEVEQRPLTHSVEFAPEALPESITNLENYFQDQIGFREDIIYWNNLLKIRYLNYSPVESVVIGKDGWLYYGEEIPYFRHETQFTEDELRLMCQTLEARNYWLASQGIGYVFLVAPNKATIYPEYVPDAYTQVNPDSAFDLLSDYLQQNCNVHFLDLRERLLEEKDQHLIYFIQDTHWNYVGAYVAYRAIIDYVAANNLVEGADFSEEETITIRAPASFNDLPALTGFPEAFPKEYANLIQFVQPCLLEGDFYRLTYIAVHLRICQKNTANMLVFRDSFGGLFMAFLAEHFRESHFVEAPYSHGLVKEVMLQSQPDLVIDELVERNLESYFLANVYLDYQATSQEIYSILPHTYRHYMFNAEFSETKAPVITNAPATFADYGLHIVVPASETGTSDPQIIISLPDIPAHEMIVVRIWLNMPAQTTLEVLHADSDGMFETAHSATAAATAPGQYEFYLALQPSKTTSILRIDPGNVPGDYIIHEIEIRGSWDEGESES